MAWKFSVENNFSDTFLSFIGMFCLVSCKEVRNLHCNNCFHSHSPPKCLLFYCGRWFPSNWCFYTPFTDSLAPDPVSTHRSRHSLSHRQSKRMPFQVDWETWPPRMSGRRRLTKSGDRWCDPCQRVAKSEQKKLFTKDFNMQNFNQFGIYDEWHIIIRLLIILPWHIRPRLQSKAFPFYLPSPCP